MSLIVPASQSFLKTLKCAYTGEPVTVLAVSNGRSPVMFFSPDAYDPTAFHPASTELFSNLGRRNGVAGACGGGRELICPYTGASMTIEEVKGLGYRAVGGFSPSTPMADPVEFARAMLTRNGKVPSKAPKQTPKPKVTGIAPVERGSIDQVSSVDLARETADKLLHKTAKPITVSMSVSAKE